MALFENASEGYAEEDAGKNETLHFYYNREERIKNAPKIVQDYYAGKMAPTRGIFRAMVANRFNRFMLFTVMLCFAVVLIVSALTSSPGLGTCAGFETELTAFEYDDNVYAQIKIHALKKSLRDKNFRLEEYMAAGEEAVAVFTFWDSAGAELNKTERRGRVQEGEFFLRTSAPDYDIMAVTADVRILKDETSLKTNSIKKR